MADRSSASITIGGAMPATTYDELAEIIAAERLSIDWDEAPFEPEDRTEGAPLRLHAHDVAWGRFDELEAFCVARGLPFARWSGACSGCWDAERVVFTGAGDAISYLASDDNQTLIDRRTAETLGGIDAILAHFDAAAFEVPPLVIAD